MYIKLNKRVSLHRSRFGKKPISKNITVLWIEISNFLSKFLASVVRKKKENGRIKNSFRQLLNDSLQNLTAKFSPNWYSVITDAHFENFISEKVRLNFQLSIRMNCDFRSYKSSNANGKYDFRKIDLKNVYRNYDVQRLQYY